MRIITPKTKNHQKYLPIPEKHIKFFNFSKTLFDDEQNILTVVKSKETAFQSLLVTYEVENTKNFKDVWQILDSVERIVNGKIRKELANRELNDNIIVFAEYKRGAEEQQGMNFKTKNEILTRVSNLADIHSKAKKNFYQNWKSSK